MTGVDGPTEPGWRGRVARAVLAGAVLAAVAPALGHVYGSGWLVPVAGAVVGSVLVDLVVRLSVRRGRVAVLVPLHVLGLLVWTSAAVRPALDGATALGGARDGVARILTAIPPVDPRGPELGVAVLAAWAAGALTAAACSRSRPSLAGVVPMLVLFAGALVVGDPRSVLSDRAALWLVVAVGAVLLAGVAAPTGDRPDRPAADDGWATPAQLARPVGALAVVVVAGLAALSVGPAVAGLGDRDRVDVRARVDPPIDVALAENPLDAVPVRRAAADPAPRFTARVRLPAGAGKAIFWHLVVLDEVGPQGWTRGESSFQRAGRSLGPVPADQAAARGLATAEVELGQPVAGLPLLPTPDRPVTVVPSGLAFDPRRAELAVPAGVSRPATLRLEVAVPDYSADRLQGASPVRRPAPPGLAPAIVARSQTAAGTSPNGFKRLAAIRRSLRDDPLLRLDRQLVANTADSEIVRLLAPPTVPTATEGDTGTTQVPARSANQAQLAAAFAQMARAQGFDVRLAVGYITPVAGRQVTVIATDADLSVWVEVRFEGLGWVPLTISAPEGGGTSATSPEPTDAGTSVADEEADASADADEADQQRQPTVPATPERTRATTDRSEISRWPFAGLAVVLVLAALAAWAPVARALRSRRRREGTGRERVLGAWDELVDGLRAGGLHVAAEHTRPDVVALVAAHRSEQHRPVAPQVGAELAWSAARTDELWFAGEDGDATEAEVDRAWLVARLVGASVSADRPVPDRVRAFLAPPRRLRPSVRVPSPVGLTATGRVQLRGRLATARRR